MDEEISRLDTEWAVVSAVRELMKIASRGDASKATYDKALELGGSLYPELLGPETSLLRRERESETAKEYRQKAVLVSIREHGPVSPLVLIRGDIDEIKNLLAIAKYSESNSSKVDQLNKKLRKLLSAEIELNPIAHSENQLVFRDAYNIHRNVPTLGSGQGYRDFELPDQNILRIRVLHPDKPEHVSGADIMYERHSPNASQASIVAIQYKIWKGKSLRLAEPRIQKQLGRLNKFICERRLCQDTTADIAYRFPFCAAFLRPTDKLQRADQKYVSTGEHLPICRIKDCTRITERGAELLEYNSVKSIALSSEVFEYLFNKGKVGSRSLTYTELTSLYKEYAIAASEDTVIIHAQEFQ